MTFLFRFEIIQLFENKIEEKMQKTNPFDTAVQAALEAAFDWYAADYPHEMQSNMVPYGDTYVNAGDQPTDESNEQCLESFKETLDIDEFTTEFLLENDDFRTLIAEKINNFKGEFS